LASAPTIFVRVFKTTFGVTPHQYVQERRVQLAAAALRTEDQRSLAEIALAFGFGNQSHMTTVLKQRIGVTPGKLRLRAGENLLNS
jgi:AraC family transcriptional regulator